MKFLVDAQLPPALCGWLTERGHDAVHVFALDMVAASDAVIAAHAVADQRCIISKDEDFLVLRYHLSFALLWLRCGNATRAALFAWLEPRWTDIERLLANGETLVEVR